LHFSQLQLAGRKLDSAAAPLPSWCQHMHAFANLGPEDCKQGEIVHPSRLLCTAVGGPQAQRVGATLLLRHLHLCAEAEGAPARGTEHPVPALHQQQTWQQPQWRGSRARQ
jgi:hypothetical protein